jgi:hypothetical protein
MYLWSKQGEYLSSQLDLNNKSNESIDQYVDFIDQWKRIEHPFIFQMDEIDIREKIIANKKILDCTIRIKNIDFFNSLQKPPTHLSSLDKLSLVRNLMMIHDIAIENNLNILWHHSMIRISNVGSHIFWLPQPPELWWETRNSNNNKMSIVYFLFYLFDIPHKKEESLLETLIKLEKNENIPWGWSNFIQYYLNNSTYDDHLFTAIFHKIWLYRAANRLGMTEKLLTLEEYNRLHAFGEQLELSNQQMEDLDVISQKDEHQKLDDAWLKNFLKPQG